jgi:hypothetical protein
MPAASPLPRLPAPDAGLDDAPMTLQGRAAVGILHEQFSRLDISVVSEAAQASAHLLAALPVVSPHEDVLRLFAMELGQEVARHPEANLNHLFQLHLQSLDPEKVEEISPESAAGKMTRLVTLPVVDTASLRGNITAPNLQALYDQYHPGQALFIFTAYPVELEAPDQDRLNRALSEQQAKQMLAAQAKMLFQAMAAASENFEARTALVGVLSQLRTLGAQLNHFRAAADRRAAPADLLQASLAIRETGSALVGEITKSVLLNTGLPPHLRETMRVGLQQLQKAGGVDLAQNRMPRVETVARTAPLVSPNMIKKDAAVKMAVARNAAPVPPPSLAVNRSLFVPPSRAPQAEAVAHRSLQQPLSLVKSDVAGKASVATRVAASSTLQSPLPAVASTTGRYASIVPVQPGLGQGVSVAAPVMPAALPQTEQTSRAPANNVLPFVGRTEISVSENSLPVLQVALPVTGVSANNVVVLDIANYLGHPLKVEPNKTPVSSPVQVEMLGSAPMTSEAPISPTQPQAGQDHAHHHGHDHGHNHTHAHGVGESGHVHAATYSPPAAPTTAESIHLPPAEKIELPPVTREDPVRLKEEARVVRDVSETPYVPPKVPEKTEKSVPVEPAVATVAKSENIARQTPPLGKTEYEPLVKNRDAEVKAKIPEGPPCGGCGRADCPYCGGGARVAAKTVRSVGPQLTLSRK